MKICIVYDTRHGSTKQIIDWMIKKFSEIKDIKTTVGRPWEIDNFNQDLFIIGSPIYWEKPLKSILDFLLAHRDDLKDRKIALFIVCLASIFGILGEKYVKKFYLKPLLDNCSGIVIGYHVFKGWLINVDYSVRDDCKKWAEELIKLLSVKQ